MAKTLPHLLLERDIPLVHNSRATCVSGQPTSGHIFLCIVLCLTGV